MTLYSERKCKIISILIIMFLVSMRFYSKSRNLELLKNMITKAIVPDQISFREEDFLVEYEIIREEIKESCNKNETYTS